MSLVTVSQRKDCHKSNVAVWCITKAEAYIFIGKHRDNTANRDDLKDIV